MAQEWEPMQVKFVGEVREVVQVDSKISPPYETTTVKVPEIPGL